VERVDFDLCGIFEYDEKAFAAFHKFGGYQISSQMARENTLVDRMFMARFCIPYQLLSVVLHFLVADYEAALNTIFTSVSKAATELMPQEFGVNGAYALVAGGRRQDYPS